MGSIGTHRTHRPSASRRRRGALLLALLGSLLVVTAAAAFDPAIEARNFAKTSERERLITKTPAFQKLLAEKEVENNLENVQIQTTDPERNPYGNICWNRNRECAGDVRFYDWAKDGFGIRRPVLFTARSGATISGNVWATKDGPPQRPAVVITTGSVQAPETLYWGTAAALASRGYVVLTYDVQGQGRSDTFGVGADTNEGVPSQAGQPFFDGTEDALDFLLSTPERRYEPRLSCGNAAGGKGTDHSDKQRRRVRQGFNAPFNPLHGLLDRSRIGIAGHSLGAQAVSYIGQLDRRVDAIVAWDNLGDASEPQGGRFPTPDCPSGSSKRPEKLPLTKPAIGFSNDYGIAPTPNTSDPDPLEPSEGERGYEKAGVDSMQVNIRGGTHEEYAFIPGQTIPALGLATYRGMDVSTWYTTAWFDRYVKCRRRACRREADHRLLSDRWRKDGPGGKVDPSGDPNLFSFYLRSRYRLTTAGGQKVACTNMRDGCPSMKPDGLPSQYFQITDAYRKRDGGGKGTGGPACALSIRGSNGDDSPASLAATDAGDSIKGRGGDDRIRGRGGDDCLYGNAGDDALYGNAGDDRARGGSGGDHVSGGPGRDRIQGNGGDDRMDGGGGRDLIKGGDGSDGLRGRDGKDILRGGAGSDSITAVGGGRDRVSCGKGRDEATVDRGDRVSKDCERLVAAAHGTATRVISGR